MRALFEFLSGVPTTRVPTMRGLLAVTVLLVVTADNAFCQTGPPSSTNWTGATDSDWHTASNWDNGVPTGAGDLTGTSAFLSEAGSTAVISTDAFALNVDLRSMTLEVDMGADLNVFGSLTMESTSIDGNLTVEGMVVVTNDFTAGFVSGYFGGNINLENGTIESAGLQLNAATVFGTGEFIAESGTVGSLTSIRPGDDLGDKTGVVNFELDADSISDRELNFDGEFQIDLVSATDFDLITVNDPPDSGGGGMACAHTIFDVGSASFDINQGSLFTAGTEFDVFFSSDSISFIGGTFSDLNVDGGLQDFEVLVIGEEGSGQFIRLRALAAVPEPSSIAPLLMMLICSGGCYRRRRTVTD